MTDTLLFTVFFPGFALGGFLLGIGCTLLWNVYRPTSEEG